jgi:hypothetical protein
MTKADCHYQIGRFDFTGELSGVEETSGEKNGAGFRGLVGSAGLEPATFSV